MKKNIAKSSINNLKEKNEKSNLKQKPILKIEE